MDTLDQDIEERFGVDVYAGSRFQQRSEFPFSRQLYFAPPLLKCIVVHQRLQLSKLVEVEQPSVSNRLGDEAGQPAITDCDEASRGHAIGHIAELIGPQLGEIVHHRLLKQIRMHLRDTVDAMAANSSQVGHTHETLSGFINERHPGEQAAVAWKGRPNFTQKASVDFEDDL